MITTLSQLIAQVESSGNSYALRYEPAYSVSADSAARMMRLTECNHATADILCSCSWGLFQIMGDNLLNLGLDKSPIAYCGDLIEQGIYFIHYCVENNCNYTLKDILTDETKRLDFASKYNGPGNPQAYADSMIETYRASQNA